ncbi:MAG: stage II sporulation protein M [Pirellulaceae bacterium]
MANPAETIAQRRADWNRLEEMLTRVSTRRLHGLGGAQVAEVSELYRAACADLSMADQYRLTPETVNYLHALIGRAHNTIYRSRRFQYHLWWDLIVRKAPQQIFRDRCVHVCALLFFGVFILSTFLAYREDLFPGFAETIVGTEELRSMSNGFAEVDFGRDIETNLFMVSFYIQHNTGIGLQCFAMGPLIIPGLYTTAFNACHLGSAFGYMARGSTEGGDNFLEFVTAHGAFELTAIALAAAAGLRIGLGWLFTGGLTRFDSLRARGGEAIPVMTASGVLFFLAAMTEGLLSPSSLPFAVKALFGLFSSALLMFYFVVLGYSAEEQSDAA